MQVYQLPDKITGRTTVAELQATLNQLIDFVRAMHLPDPNIVVITNDLPQHETKTYNERKLTDIGQIVFHHVGDSTGADVSPEATARFHVNKRDWPGIAYHFYIRKNGQIYQTQDLATVSYHCNGQEGRSGYCNFLSVGVCLEGSFISGRTPTPEQLSSARELNAYLLKLLGLSKSAILQHKQVPGHKTACPGTTVDQWWPQVLPA